eukprot:IDg15754t1
MRVRTVRAYCACVPSPRTRHAPSSVRSHFVHTSLTRMTTYDTERDTLGISLRAASSPPLPIAASATRRTCSGVSAVAYRRASDGEPSAK